MITHVAIIFNGVTHSLPKPNRHHHVMHMLAFANGNQSIDGETQGFLDDQGNFLDRAQAWDHAKACGQIIRKVSPDGELYSENVW